MANDSATDVVLVEASEPTQFLPVWAYVAIGLASVTTMSLCLLLFCKCFVRSQRKKSSESGLVVKPADPWLTGVIADQAIEFVVPSAALNRQSVSHHQRHDTTCTEDSDSDVVFRRSTGVAEERRLRKRSSLVTFYISPEDLERAHYPEVIPEVPKRKSLLAGLGKVGFSMNYSVARQLLCVKLIGASDLPSALARDSANPFAKVMLLPDKTPKFLSKIQRHTINPSFNETFTFVVKKESLDKKDLKISVLDYDRFSRKLLIGFVKMPLKDAGVRSDIQEDVQTGDIWTDLSLELDMDKQGKGELLYSLCYNPENSFLTVVILKTRNLENEDKVHLVYVKVALYVRKRLVRTKKTISRRFAPDMEFNDSFPIHVSNSSLPDVDLVVTVCGKGGRNGKHVLGRCQVGANCPSEQGTSHWQDMLASPRSSAAQWHSFAG